MTDEGDISNYLGVNIKKNSYGTFKLSQSHMVDKIINHIGFTVSASLNSIETPSVKSLLHKDKYIPGRKCVRNYRAAFGTLSYLKG